MRPTRLAFTLAIAVGLLNAQGPAAADTFGTGANQFTIDFVTIGNPGNPPDATSSPCETVCVPTEPYQLGSVDYDYRIGKYEVTNVQYRAFLNAKAAVGDPHGLYSTEMSGTYGGIARSGSGTDESPWVYSAKNGDANWDNRPVNWVSFWDAVRFVNWLHNGLGNGDTESGAYVNVGNQITLARQADAKYWIPTENEWFKAAYHKNDGVTGNYWDYPTSSDNAPSQDLINPDPGNNANYGGRSITIGGPYYTTEVGEFENSDSPYGTFDQGGNVQEWIEEGWGADVHYMRGGNWRLEAAFLWPYAGFDSIENPWIGYFDLGFRVASIPEPSSLLLGALAATGLLMRRRSPQ